MLHRLSRRRVERGLSRPFADASAPKQAMTRTAASAREKRLSLRSVMAGLD
jgi:hypothetical protein